MWSETTSAVFGAPWCGFLECLQDAKLHSLSELKKFLASRSVPFFADPSDRSAILLPFDISSCSSSSSICLSNSVTLSSLSLSPSPSISSTTSASSFAEFTSDESSSSSLSPSVSFSSEPLVPLSPSSASVSFPLSPLPPSHLQIQWKKRRPLRGSGSVRFHVSLAEVPHSAFVSVAVRIAHINADLRVMGFVLLKKKPNSSSPVEVAPEASATVEEHNGGHLLGFRCSLQLDADDTISLHAVRDHITTSMQTCVRHGPALCAVLLAQDGVVQ
eukprot:gnl/Hemi2/24274_TR8156_c0_g1_i2.p1 gnl/Hemi2/24274_TR8156_c0_g1~~gnl/Hemi2/24274_TR8156_c0_g1_i2.p1  ORF type:complete len:273 (+),score=48.88 gnl/Hemi2/24274_TR8156_c0_g1_i2:313-1131(+)